MKIIAFTGAGVSKESGIDTFQDRPGIREKLTRTFALDYPEEFRKVMKEFRDCLSGKEPNDAHKALAEYEIPILTMNVDNLHELAGSTDIVKMHGRMPTDEEMPIVHKLRGVPVLYEDSAPEYSTALNKLSKYQKGDVLLVIGASNYTQISFDIKCQAQYQGMHVVEIQRDAASTVRKYLERLVNGDIPADCI